MGSDEYHPIAKKGSNLNHEGGVGFTVVDAIDTMQIMGLTDEYQRSKDWIAQNLTFERDGNFNTFEVRACLPTLLLVLLETYNGVMR
jgi:hypothetical protein